MNNRSANTTRVYLFGAANKVIQILCPFAIRTIIIYKLGADYLGLSSLFTSILSVLSVSELGVGSAITFCLYKPVADNDIDSVNALMGLMRKLYRCIGLFILGAGLIIMPFSGYFISGTYPQDINIYYLYLIYLVNSVATYFGFAYKRTLLDVYQQGYINYNIESVVDIVKYALQIIILFAFADYYLYALVLPVSTIAITIAIEFYSRKKHPNVIPGGQVSREQTDIIKSKVMYLSLHAVASKITNSIDSIVISSFLGLTWNAVYGNYQYIYTSVFAFISLGYDALRPAVANYYYQSSKEDNYFLYKSLKLLSAWVSAWSAICLLCLYQPFITLWIGKDYLLEFPALIMVVIYFYSNVIRQFYSGVYISVTGLWNKTLVRQIIAALMNLVLDVVLVRKYSVAGIIFASFITNALVALPMDVYVTYRYVLKEKALKGIIELLPDLVLFGVMGVVTYLACSCVSMSGIVGLLIRLIICLVLPNLIMLIIFGRTQRFQYTRTHLVGMIRKKNR